MLFELSQDNLLFQDQLKKLFGTGDKENPYHKLKLKAWDRFLELGLPSKKMESYQYIKLKKLFAKNLSPAKPVNPSELPIYPECKDSCLVFVNGHFSESLSRLGGLGKVTCTPLKEAIYSFGTFFNNQWTRSIKEERDPFVLINAALHEEGAFIYIPPKTIVEKPIQCLFLHDTDNHFMNPRVHLYMGALSQAQVVTTHVSLQENTALVNAVLDGVIDEGAKLTLSQVAVGKIPSWILDATRVHLKRDSDFKTFLVTEGSETARFDYCTALTQENAQVHLNGVWMLNGSRESHIHVLVDHQAPHCESLQLYKGALNDVSRSSFEGKIWVRKEAQKTNSFQLNNNLLLSNQAQAYSKPNLEIFADDVKASHGATVGQLSLEELFYLETRGFPKNEAKSLLTKAFLREVIQKMEVPSVRAQALECTDRFLRG